MADVFFNPYAGKGKAWSLQNCWLYLDNTEQTDGILAATESVQIQYARQISTRYPLMATKAPIKILGVPNGTCTLGSILGPNSGVQTFLNKFGSTCKTFTLTVKQARSDKTFNGAGQDCQDETTEQTLLLEGCLGQQMSYTIQMQDNLAIAQGQFVLTFDKLSWASV